MKNKILPLMLLLICSTAYAQTYTVERVIDGDTIVVDMDGKSEKVQLIGINAPDEGADGSQEATEFLKTILIFPEKIKLEYDTQALDEYGRALAYVYMNWKLGINVSFAPEVVTKDQEMWMFVNTTMVKNGYAAPRTIPPNVKHAELFNRLHQEAFEGQRGIYKKKKSGVVPDGTYYEYNKDGSIRIEASYKKGQLINTKAFDGQGNLVSDRSYGKSQQVIEEKLGRASTSASAACTMDAKQCPDGSYVGRVAPDCKFRACPKEKEASEVKEGDACLQDEECKMTDCKDAIKKSQGCDFNKPICWNNECTCQFICI